MMKLPKTTQALQNFGKVVVKEGRGILAKRKMGTSKLSKNFDYLVKKSKDKIQLEWVFGNSDEYWEYVNEGVRGKGGGKGTGKLRGVGSPFKYKTKMPPRKVLLDWIKSKRIKGRVDKKWKGAGNKGGQFITNESFAFLLQRSIFQKGLYRTQFFTKPYDKQLKKNSNKISEAFADDLLNNFKNS